MKQMSGSPPHLARGADDRQPASLVSVLGCVAYLAFTHQGEKCPPHTHTTVTAELLCLQGIVAQVAGGYSSRARALPKDDARLARDPSPVTRMVHSATYAYITGRARFHPPISA